jgi:hypothetical protein
MDGREVPSHSSECCPGTDQQCEAMHCHVVGSFFLYAEQWAHCVMKILEYLKVMSRSVGFALWQKFKQCVSFTIV